MARVDPAVTRSKDQGISSLLTIVLFLAGGGAYSQGACSAPPGFVDSPHPAVASPDQLVLHTEEMVIHRPLQVVLDSAARTSLEKAITQKGSLPSVSGTHNLTTEFGNPGSRRITCLTDGSTLEEEVLENGRQGDVARFRYVVWNYTSPQAKRILYGVGLFERTDLHNNTTRVKWTYSFKLDPRKFPGILGGFGEWLFRVGFLDRDYAQMMRSSLSEGKVLAEKEK